MKNLNLTVQEITVLRSFETNYDCAEDEKYDNATYTLIGEICDVVDDLSLNQIKGVLGSLTKKGLVGTEDNTFHLTNLGIDVFYSL
ncbi:hypothetical protein VmeM32_00030 [Vibrio phage vB_VmeM-32]|nr:hypothetical protein VmeM32_00030 [Vibrio phage vB_VmeM-32]